MDDLRLVALDSEDLEIISAHLQDAVLRVDDMTYLPSQKRFAAIVNRFDWQNAVNDEGMAKKNFIRRRTALHIDRVLEAKLQNISLPSSDSVLSLLAVQFEETDAPGGYITLIFAGDGAVRLHVECIEFELQDLGSAWHTKSRPEHSGEDAGGPRS